MSRQHFPSNILLVLLALLLCVVGCAKISSPEGGPYDMTPPKVVRCTPELGSTGVTSTRVRITFDEYIQLERGEDKIIYSPPQRIPPKALVNQKHLVITYQDSLVANTTYTIDFNRAIKDYNEGNYLEQYVYAFSTGDYLDTMQVAGQVLDAYTLQPVPHILAGVYATPLPVDSVDKPMTRMTYTDEEGYFTLKNVRDGAYYAIALVDMDRSYSYNAPNESFAITPDSFHTEVVLRSAIPPAEKATDTLSIDSLGIEADTLIQKGDSLITATDSIVTTADSVAVEGATTTTDSLSPYLYQPDDLVLLLNRPKTSIIRLERLSRRDSVSLLATFTEPLDTLPQLSILSPDYLTTPTSYYTDLSTDRKSLVYWLKPHDSLARDSLVVSFAYPTTDSIGTPINKLDTMTLRAPKVSAQKAKAQDRRSVVAPKAPDSLSVATDTTALAGAKEVKTTPVELLSHEGIDKETTRDSLWISYKMPILSIDTTLVALAKVVDSIPQPIPYQLLPDSIRCSRWLVDFPKEPGASYSLKVDTAAIVGLYDAVSAPAQKDLKIASETELGNLSITLTGHPEGSPLYLYLLSSTEEILATAQPDTVGVVRFTELAPGAYYLKLYVDLNGNGSWDAGIYPSTPPEPVRYLPQAVNVQARFDTKQAWAYDGTPLSKQRPKDLKATGQEEDKDNSRSSRDKTDRNVEYAQRMRERYGKRWNPTDRERKMMGLPSRHEERLARERGDFTEIGATPQEEKGEKEGREEKPERPQAITRQQVTPS